tara:strand:+ start:306 stop:491 length:186 start_codon:yes stop_codon:yes gene_type:complete
MKMNTKIKIISIGVLTAFLLATCSKDVVCQTCDEGHPISNLFLNSCPEEWEKETDENPCTK